MGRPRKGGTQAERRLMARRAKRAADLLLYSYVIELDDVGRKVLHCIKCHRVWYWPISAAYREDHYMACSGHLSWQPPASWDALPFPVAPGSPLPTDPAPLPPSLPLRLLPWPDTSTAHTTD